MAWVDRSVMAVVAAMARDEVGNLMAGYCSGGSGEGLRTTLVAEAIFELICVRLEG